MTKQNIKLTQSKIAKIAGFGYLIIFISGIFANFFVLENIIVSGDATATANNIMVNESLFRIGIFCFIVMVIFDVVLTWALYIIFKPVNHSISLLTAWFRLINCTIFGIALYNLFYVLKLLSDAPYLKVFDIAQLQAQAMLSLEAFNYTWLIGLIFFAFHLFLLGHLIVKSVYVPSIIGILLILASLGYLTDSFAYFLMPNYEKYKTIFLVIVAVPAFIAELSFAFWLLLKGNKIP